MKEKVIFMDLKDLQSFKNEILSAVQQLQVQKSKREAFMRSKDLMNEYGLTSSHIQKMRTKGTIPYTKMGDTFLYPRHDIEKILNKNMRPANS